jgi:TusA-related sulfurtransferase
LNVEKTIIQFLDITREVCPLTFVRTRLRLDRMAPGEVLEVRLNAGEPLENVPRSARELGHAVEILGPENPDRPHEVHRLRIYRN